ARTDVREPFLGLDLTANRMYNSTWGRWLTPDPGGKKVVRLDDPQTWNMYAYVRNNPTTLTDPSGLDFYLSCQQESSTCGHVEGYKGLFQGTTNANGFNATVVTSASLSDPNSGNTATVNGNGLQITTKNGTAEGVFINNTAAADISGSGALAGFGFHVNYSDTATGNLAGGTVGFNGSLEQARALLQSGGAFNLGLLDEADGSILGFHPGTDQFRFGSGPSPHLSVPEDYIYRATGGTEGQVTYVLDPNPNHTIVFHVDARVGSGHARDVVCGYFGIGCQQ
ncbi:MAG TPA: RHS repeat-associated core domain-containing protein, partial [Terriglobia bacterium]|nr:RHS repeat-associated core domain-containing protein [Terriglobia bacterium]